LDVTKPQTFINEKEIIIFILALTPQDARKMGIKHRSELKYIKEKAREGTLNFNTSVMRRLLKYSSS
jgi:hypothetical protein